MSKHIFYKQDKKRERIVFAGNANDGEFENIKEFFRDTVWPKDLKVVHIGDNETVSNSPRVKKVASWPRAKQETHALWGKHVVDVHYTQMLREDYGYES